MAKLVSGVAQEFFAGTYNLSVDYTSGSVALAYSVNGGTALPIPDGSFSADASKTIDLPRCMVTATFTSSVVELNLIRA